ncbi:hypothetical protein [Aeromicrobium endophyticum]|uniref:Uncharacterized protein n=1 Tax=Aeromicrobium endophyticum TaxID=2292704 RepID=A0A371PCI7_9ACTN|nr:hypothetical protein [Aeromicrobium endophyticum]REK73642.1 hypothetical protein DX116_08940 [Aeromicrobium endophyticum]
MNDVDPSASESIAADFEGDAFDDWIGGATVSKRSVAIYGKPGLYAEYQELERELERIEAENKGGGEMAGSGFAKVTARMAEIYDEWIESKSTWIVRALDDDQTKELEAELGEGPLKPDELVEPVLPAKHTENQAKAHTLKMRAYEEAKPLHDEAVKEHEAANAEYVTQLNLRIIAEAVERIDFANGRVQHSITVERLLSLKKKLGERQLLKLINASQLALLAEPEIHAPFSQDSSETDQT